MSLTLSGLVIGVLAILAQNANVNIAPENIQTTVETIAQFAAVAMIYWGRIRKGDLNWFGGRK